MSGKAKAFIAIAFVVVVGSAAAVSLRNRGGRGAEVRVEAIEARDLVAKVTASGNIRARGQVDVSSEVSAKVTAIHVIEGQDVQEGDLLMELDRTQFEAALARAQAALSQMRAQASQQEANLLRAQREYDRVAALQARDSLLVSRQQVEDAETNLDVAKANLEASRYSVQQAEASVEEARDGLEKTIIRAGMDGKITRLEVEVGETVIVGTMNNAGSLILSISDLSVIEVVVQVDETDVPLLSLGDSAVVEIDAFPGRTFSGRVTEIGNSAIRPPSQQASGQQAAIDFEVVVTLDATDVELRPDLSATADIITDMRTQVPSIPIIALTVRAPEDDSTKALMEASDDPEAFELEGAFLVADGEVTFTAVDVGITGDEYFEVLSGVALGDTVVAGPYQAIRQLRTGDPVRVSQDTSRERN